MRKFPHEENFWSEMNQLTNALKTEFKLVAAPPVSPVKPVASPVKGQVPNSGRNKYFLSHLEIVKDVTKKILRRNLIQILLSYFR